VALVLVVALMLGVLVWLARNHEIDELQRALDRDNAAAVQTLRQGLARRQQDLHGLAMLQLTPEGWPPAALALLDRYRDWLRVEWRDAHLRVLASADSPYYPPFEPPDEGPRGQQAQRIREVCANAARLDGAAYTEPFRAALGRRGRGSDADVPADRHWRAAQRLPGGDVFAQRHAQQHAGAHLHPAPERGLHRAGRHPAGGAGRPRRGARLFTSQQLLDLPGDTLVLRMDSGRQAPSLPNVMTALVTGLSIALVTVLVLLARDNRRRLQAEPSWARRWPSARRWRTRWSPACARATCRAASPRQPGLLRHGGLCARGLIGHALPAPYWPPEHVQEYTERQAVRLTGAAPSREGVESVFMRKDGTRFPVLIIEALIGPTGSTAAGWGRAGPDGAAPRRGDVARQPGAPAASAPGHRARWPR
jgi:two-component system sensor histidine kinase DctS